MEKSPSFVYKTNIYPCSDSRKYLPKEILQPEFRNSRKFFPGFYAAGTGGWRNGKVSRCHFHTGGCTGTDQDVPGLCTIRLFTSKPIK
jgi:hypothetical protein